MSFTPLGDALHQTIASQSPLRRQLEASDAVRHAAEIFAEMFHDESRYVKPLFLKNRTLTITCGSSIVAQEIRLHQTELVQKINERMRKNEVDRIRYLA